MRQFLVAARMTNITGLSRLRESIVGAIRVLHYNLLNRQIDSRNNLRIASLELVRPFALTSIQQKNKIKKRLPPRIIVPENEIEEVFIKGGGKGGQKINKTNSKVQLKHLPTGIVVTSQATRSREQNRKVAREKLADEIEYMRDPVNSRRAKAIQMLQREKQKHRKKAAKRSRERAATRLKQLMQHVKPTKDGIIMLDESKIPNLYLKHLNELKVLLAEAKTEEQLESLTDKLMMLDLKFQKESDVEEAFENPDEDVESEYDVEEDNDCLESTTTTSLGINANSPNLKR
ncbi:RF-1 domain-containing protein [Dipodascopsis uninucleata]